jgi:hypothetical protein
MPVPLPAMHAAGVKPGVAFYYPGPVWSDPGWVKNLLLYFDGVALLVPDYLRDKPFQTGGPLATELQDSGLLHILEPETFIDRASTQELAKSLIQILDSGKLDDLVGKNSAFEELSYSRLGSNADAGLSEEVYRMLRERGLARPSRDGLSIPMHPMARALVLVLWSQILRPLGAKQGLDLQPATDRPEINEALAQVLRLRPSSTPGDVVTLDTISAGVDLSTVPVSKVLRYREKHQLEYAEYARNLREYVREISLLPESERAQAVTDRSAELAAAAKRLASSARRAWAGRAAFGLGIAGAAWTFVRGDPFGSVMAGGAAAAGASAAGHSEVSAHSYLFGARRALGPGRSRRPHVAG